ncbi:MAG: sensor histidine kinase [Synergistaceae bacterium]|jgi:two-component sensor histidine kinase|nr:sensor histidine kinase [Synergistaceae bacterium]
MNITEICLDQTNLSESDILVLANLEKNLQFIADLTIADIFVDCLNKTHSEAIVVSQAMPQNEGASLYSKSVIGMPVYRENEPAVFHVFESGIPVRDLKGTTQENIMVKQDVVPIKANNGRVIGVLIRERDIQSSIIQEKKFNELARRQEERSEMFFSSDRMSDTDKIAIREAHHRVKNSLQLVASIMNIQAQQSHDPKVRLLFEENIARVLSIASTHDIMSMGELTKNILLCDLLIRVADNMETLIRDTHHVKISVESSNVFVGSDAAISIALITNELISNSILHGFNDGNGNIHISIHGGSLYSSVCVEDDGHGFDTEAVDFKRLGLRLVSTMVRDKLKGDFFISSSEKGTRASFSFKVLESR